MPVTLFSRIGPSWSVEDRERGLVAADCPPGGHPDHGGLVEPEDEPQVVRQPGEKGHLGRAGIREQRREPVAAKDVERRVANGVAHPRKSVLEII